MGEESPSHSLYVYQTIEYTILRHVQDKENPKDIWDAIAKLNETNAKARKLQLKRS